MNPIEKVLAKLPDAKQSGSGWTATCPAHGDDNPSLSIAVGDDGRVLLHDHAGCKFKTIVDALGLTVAELRPTVDHLAQTNGKLNGAQSCRSTPALKSTRKRKPGGPRKIVATYDYRDEGGTLVFQVVRYKPKTFRQRRPDGNGGWIWNLEGCRGDLLYRLPELLAALAREPEQLIVIAEGEKDVEALAKLGILATCNAGGAGKWTAEHARFLRGCTVVSLPHNDEAGRGHGQSVATSVHGDVKSVRIVELPGLPATGDVSDWIAAGGTAEALWDLVRTAPEWKPETDVEAKGPRAVAIPYSEIEAKEIDWLWEGRIARGTLTMLVGRPGAGKSFLCCDLAARVSTGTPFIDGTTCERGSVILTNFEDAPAHVTKGRLTACGADPAKVIHLTEIEEPNGKRRLLRADDVATIEAEVRRIGDVRLLIIDPAGDWIGGSADAHRDNEVRAKLAPLAAMAERTNVAVLVVMHCRKSGGTNADETALGSVGFIGKSRSVVHLSFDPEDADGQRRLLAAGKSNLAERAPTLAFSIGGTPARVVWEQDADPRSADEIAAQIVAGSRGGKDPSKLDEAAEWLRDRLADGPAPAADVERDATTAGIAMKTLRRAATDLGIKRSKQGFRGGWEWSLRPRRRPQVGEGDQGENVGAFGESWPSSGDFGSDGSATDNEASDFAQDRPAIHEAGGAERRRERVTI